MIVYHRAKLQAYDTNQQKYKHDLIVALGAVDPIYHGKGQNQVISSQV